MKTIQCQALNGCGFLLNQQYSKEAVGGSNGISAGDVPRQCMRKSSFPVKFAGRFEKE